MAISKIVKAVAGEGGLAHLRKIRDQARIALAPWQMPFVRRRLQHQRLTLAQMAQRSAGFTLFFAPEAGLTPYFASHCILARTLKDGGHPVMIAGCFDLYPRCVFLDSGGRETHTPRQRADACNRCGKSAYRSTAEYGLESLDLTSFLDDEDWARIEALLENPPQDMRQFKVDGIAFGNIAGAEASVTLKTLDFAGREQRTRQVLLQYLRGALISYFAMKKIIGTVPIKRIVYFSEYSMLLGAVLAAQRADIPISNMSHAHIMTANRQRPTLHSNPIALLSYRNMLQQWPHWRQLALPASRVDEIFADSLFRLTSDAVMVYSRKRSGAAAALYQSLNLSNGKPLLVAFTSSLDEIYANRLMLEAVGGEPFSTEQPFADQVEWLSFLIAHAEETDNFQLVVRVHPREGANRREAASSEHLNLLRQNFDRPYRNVRFIWPGDSVSSYDLMELADAGTSSWSSTAVEMARLGAPTVVAFQNYTPMPIGDVVAWGRTPQEYLAAIDQALAAEPSLERVRLAARWMNVRMFGNSIDLSDLVPHPDYGGLPPYRKPKAAPVIEDVLIRGKTALDVNLEQLSSQQNSESLEIENQALLRNLRQAVWLLCLGEAITGDYRLHRGPVDELPPGVDAAAWRLEEDIIFRTRTQTVRRRSRMVERLVQLCAQTGGLES